MVDIEKLDDELYRSRYGRPRVGDYNEIWERIKSNPEVLQEAVQVRRDKFDQYDTVKGLAICDAMLRDYKSVDEASYNNLINSIYTNPDIARIVLEGASNGGCSFLLMSLCNPKLKLTEEQKAFAVNEAMNKIGTIRWQQREKDFSKRLDDIGVSDDDTYFINIDGCINPIGQKSGSQYMNYMFSSLSKTQAHGVGEFDIRYHILRNPNWSLEEKQKLIMDFWCDDEAYDECLEQWEWGIVNGSDNSMLLLDKSDLYEYTYDMLKKFYGDKETTDRMWNEIQFCRQMHELRPMQWELGTLSKKKVFVRNNEKK